MILNSEWMKLNKFLSVTKYKINNNKASPR